MEEVLVKLPFPHSETSIQLSPIDQFASRTYSSLLLVFASSWTNDTFEHIQSGLSAALSEFPDYAATVTAASASARKELELRLGPESGVQLSLVDLRSPHASKKLNNWIYGDYSELAARNFPLSSIPTDIVLSRHATKAEEAAEELPAFLGQINLIDGGIILGVSWHHSVSDARAVSVLAESWARHTKVATQGTPASPNSPSEQASERWRLRFGQRDANIDNFPGYVINSQARSQCSPKTHLIERQPPRPAVVMSTWHFCAERLSSLKQDLGSDRSRVTQSEAVSALIWQRLSVARRLDRSSAKKSSLLSLVCDYRSRIRPPFAPSFIGNVCEPNACLRLSCSELCAETEETLGRIAESIKQAYERMDENAARAFVGLLNKLPAATDLTWDLDRFPGPDLVVSDMSGMNVLDQDWGSDLGRPKSIRVAGGDIGNAYILPQDPNGGIEVQLQCDNGAVENLKHDASFTRYASFRG